MATHDSALPAIAEHSTVTVSVVIAALNEEANIGQLVPYLRSMAAVDEVVVCDGGSCDGTVQVAEECGAVIVRAHRNRGAQLNAGAQAANGEVLWFLHADARPHPDSGRFMVDVMCREHACGGNFRLCFDDDRWPVRLCEMIARRQRRRGIYYGDSGVFVRRQVFDTLGGYREWPLFEDYDFVRRLERWSRCAGQRTVYSTLPLMTSARRLQRRPLRTVLLWAVLQLLFSLGLSPHVLARLYHR